MSPPLAFQYDFFLFTKNHYPFWIVVFAFSAFYFFLNTPLMAAISSANDFFLMANQKIANPPIPATATEPMTIPAIAPPERPLFSYVPDLRIFIYPVYSKTLSRAFAVVSVNMPASAIFLTAPDTPLYDKWSAFAAPPMEMIGCSLT